MSESAVLSYAHGFISYIPWEAQDGDGSGGIGIDRNPSDSEEMLVETQKYSPNKTVEGNDRQKKGHLW